MKWTLPALVGLCLAASGCGDSTATNSVDAAASNASGAVQGKVASEGLVSGFTDPELQGMVVRDHPKGAQVVTPPPSLREEVGDSTGLKRGPPTLRSDRPKCLCSRGAVFTSVNGTPIRNAAHFRDMMNVAAATGEDIKLGQQMFLLDRGDGKVAISSSPPEAQ